MNTKLYVGNLPDTVSRKDLQELFAPFGPVQEANVVTDHTTGCSRGFGFVTLSTPEAAQAAEQALNGHNFEGKSLIVNEARPRQERSSHSFKGPRDGDRAQGNRY